jgi:DNA-binding CsgD family transcriptional regulator/pimeloyl-ACP methyl ester carboxylesterase
MTDTTPAFRYVRSADGTSIAWNAMGDGAALVIMPPVPFSNVAGEWAVPLVRDVYERLASRFRVVRYDGRGTGASQRTVDDLGVGALAADLEAVLDAARVERAALLALYTAGAPAVTFAAQHPRRVSHLALFGVTPSGAEVIARPGTAALLGLLDDDWELFTQTAALDWMGWRVAEDGERVSAAFRTTTVPKIARAAIGAFATCDLRPLLPRVAAPTLVLHRREGRHVSLEQSAELAALLPAGQLHVLEGSSATLFFEDPVGTAGVIAGFVGGEPRLGPGAAGVELSGREQEVLRRIARGDSNAEIAGRLGLSVHTVERHASNIYRKLDVRSRSEATAWALRHGLG